MKNLQETFTYDDMNRLTGITLKRSSGQDLHCGVSYDALGRMTSKQAVTAVNGTPQVSSVFSQPAFDATKVHALASAQSMSDLFPTTAQTVTYTGFDKADKIKQGNDSICYTYGYDHQRIFMEEHVGNTTRTKRYVGNCEYVTETTGNATTQKWLTSLTGPTGVYAVVVTQNNTNTIHYILKDNLGSWTAIVNSSGTVEQRLSFDAWGNLRNPNSWSGSFTGTPMFDRGFTGHEHLYAFGLINMNGRMYDPITSSFLSVDQYVGSPENAQGFNRYAYCSNNPLRYVDPSGWLQVGGGASGYTPNSSANANDPYAYAEHGSFLEPRDLGLRQLSTTDPVITWMEGNDQHVGGSGAKGGWYRDSNGIICYSSTINPSSLKDQLSYLGPYYLDGNTYYSLFGETFNMNTVAGQVVYKLETETWKNFIEYLVAVQQFEDEYNKGLHNEWETGPVEKCTDFNGIIGYKITTLGLSDDNKYAFSYADAMVYFIVYKEPSAMITKVGCWDISERSGNGNYFGTSGEIPGYNITLNTYGNDSYRNSSANKNYVVKLVFPTQEARINALNRIKTTFGFFRP